MEWRYSSFLQVNQDFIDVFSAEQDASHPDAWKGFIPHDAMRQILQGLIESLERKTPKSLWLHGSYGTGKTYCQFVLKHLLEDPWPEVEQYFRAHRFSADLCRRLEALRARHKGLVVFLSGSAFVDSNLKLMAAIQQGVKEALLRRGEEPAVTATLYDSVLARLTAPDSPFNWERSFARYRGEFLGQANTAQDVVKMLQDVTRSIEARHALLGLVAKVMEREGFVTMDSPQAIKSWLRETIETRNLGWLVVIWDEFTDFFERGAGTDGLQELAEFTEEAPFYLLLATHRAPDTLALAKQPDWRKVRDRFRTFPYNLEPVTTYRLMGDVVQVNPELSLLWEDRHANLWARIKSLVGILGDESARATDFERLVPIHPYAAHLLSLIAQQFTSAQRTVFAFMKRQTTGGFPPFLAEYPQADWMWYTADGLWDYFFTEDNPDLVEDFRDALLYFRSRTDAIQGEALRVFKAAMLLIALSRIIPNAPRLRPTTGNLQRVFLGTLLGDRVASTLEALEKDDHLRRVAGMSVEETLFTIPQGTIDRRRIEEIKKSLPRFRDEFGRDAGIQHMMVPILALGEPALARRASPNVLSVDEHKQRHARLQPPSKPYQVGLVWVVALSGDEVKQALTLLKVQESLPERLVFAVLEEPFGRERFEQYQAEQAQNLYYREVKDPQNGRFHENRRDECVRQWLASVRTGNVRLVGQAFDVRVTGTQGVVQGFRQLIDRLYPHRAELVLNNQPLFNESFGVAVAETGLGDKTAFGATIELVTTLRAVGLWPERGPLQLAQLSRHPDHPLAHMKKVVERHFEGQLVDLNRLWGELQASPFGLMPSPMALCLVSLMMREYCQGYYWHDGTNTRPLDGTRMASILNDVLHDKATVILTRTSDVARRFCELVGEIFDLVGMGSHYPGHAREALRKALTQIGYPLWALNYDIRAAGRSPYKGLIELESLLADTGEADVVLTDERLSRVVQALERDRTALKDIVRPERYEQGMETLCRAHSPKLIGVCHELHLSLRDLMKRLRALMNEEVWLWREQEITKRLPRLEAELLLVAALNRLTGRSATDLAAGLEGVSHMLIPGKLPLFVYTVGSGEIAPTVRDFATFVVKQEIVTEADILKTTSLAESLSGAHREVSQHLRAAAAALRKWTEAETDLALSEDQAQQVLDGLPNLSHLANADELRRHVKDGVRALRKRQLGESLRAKWVDLTSTESPDAWSRQRGVPIQWLLDAPEYGQLWTAMRSPDGLSEEMLSTALNVLEKAESALEQLADEKRSRLALLRIAVGDYPDLVQTDEDMADLKRHLLREAGHDVTRWTMSQVQSAGEKWVQSAYWDRFHPRILERIEHTQEADAKALLKKLVQDPLVGMKVLQGMR